MSGGATIAIPSDGPVDTVLSRLEHARSTGDGKWICRCPAHDDKSPSLAIKEGVDGRVLLHCFAGCSVSEVVEALGLSMTDIFPLTATRRDHRRRGERKPWSPKDLLQIIYREVLILLVAFEETTSGIEISQHDRDRARVAATRVRAAIEEAGYAC